MNEDFASRTGDALLGFPCEDQDEPETAPSSRELPEQALLDVPPPAPKLWDAIERQLRREGVIK